MQLTKSIGYVVAGSVLFAVAGTFAIHGQVGLAVVCFFFALAMIILVALGAPTGTACDWCGRETKGQSLCYRCRERLDRVS